MKWKFLKFGYMQLVKKEGEFSGLWWMKFRTLDSWGQVNSIRWNWKNFWEGLSCEKRNFNHKGWKYGKCFGKIKQLEERYLEFFRKRFRFIVNDGLQWIF